MLGVGLAAAPPERQEPPGPGLGAPQGSVANPLDLTDEEIAFLKGREIRLGVDAVRPPFEFVDNNGVYSGISASFVEEAAKRLGIVMTPVKDMAWTEAMQKVKTGGVDVIPKATPTPEREKFLIFTKPYVTFPTVIATRKDRHISGIEDIHGLRVGVVKGLVVDSNLTKDHPDMQLTRFPDLETGLRALSTGALDAFVDNLGAVAYTIDKLGLANLKIAAPTAYTQDLAMGVRKDWPLLASALDKALASMTNVEKADIKSRWLAIKLEAAVDWQAILSWALPVAVGLLLIIFITARANRKLGREMRERMKAEKRFQTMTANLPGAIVQLRAQADGTRRYTYLSPQAREFFGVEPEVVIREGRTLNWHPEDLERITEAAKASFANRKPANMVGRVILPDGQERWINLTASPNPQADGELLFEGFILDITQRKLAEMEYLASERKIKAMSHAVDDALVMLDGQGRVVFWNPAAERLFGYGAAEAMGMDFHTIAAPSHYRDKAATGLRLFAQTGQGPVLGVTTEIEGQDRHGRVFPVEVTLSSFQVDNEWFAVGTVRDISKRRQAEEALARGQRMLQSILDASPVGVAISSGGVIRFANPRYTDLVGARVGDSTESIYVNPQDRDKVLAKLENTNVVPEVELQMFGPSGEVRDILATFLSTEYDGQPGVLGWLVDITELKDAERAIKESERRLGDIIDFLPDPTMVIDAQARVVAWNRSMETLTGVGKEAMLGKGDHEYSLPFYGERRPILVDLAGQWNEEIAGRYDSVKRDGECLIAESFNTHMHPEGIYLLATATALHDAAGRVVLGIETVRDISERKRAESLMVEKEVAEQAAQRAEQARQEAEMAREWAEVAQEELKGKLDEIERFNRLALGRERRVIELKRQANTLAILAGFDKPYKDDGGEAEALAAPEEPAAELLEQKLEVDLDSLGTILDMAQFDALLNDFCDSVGIAAAIIDVEGKVLAAARWQRACTDFHRQNQTTCARCIDSDTQLASCLSEGQRFTIYRCQNGLTDAASPIIIDGRHVANTFVGQFFTQAPDLEHFRAQAREVGFDEEAYLEAIGQVPVVDESRLPSILGFLVGMASMAASSYEERVRALQAEAAMAKRTADITLERAAALSLAEDAEQARSEIEQYKGRLELLVKDRTEELQASEERSRLLLDSAGEGIFGVDSQGQLTFINPSALELLGYGESELLGRGVHSLIHHSRQDGSAYPVEECPMHSSFTQGVTHHVDDEVLWRKNGQPLPVEYSSTPISKDGQTLGAVITFRDVSERKRVETEMRQYVDDLERFNRLTLGREQRMIELKEEVNALLDGMGRPKKYKIVDQV